MRELIGKRNITDIITDELIVITYEYNSQEPRFFSKYFAEKDPMLYQTIISNATGGSSAAPGYFTPQKRTTFYNQTELMIDGGVIANNPSLVAYHFATKLMRKPSVRVVSLGTGVPAGKEYDPENWNRFAYRTMAAELVLDIDVFVADFVVKKAVEAKAKVIEDQLKKKGVTTTFKSYLRLQTVTDLPLDKTDPESIQALIDKGNEVRDENKEAIKAIIEQVVDEKFGYFAKS